MTRKPEVLLIAVALIVFLVGCSTWISVLSGPRTLSAGDTATYVLSLGGDGPNQADVLWVVAEVPDSWSLLSSYYTGTIGGVPVSGPGVVDDPYMVGSPRDGFQNLCVLIPEESEDPSDSGEMTLDFDVVEIPEGEFYLKFWFIAQVGPDLVSGPPAIVEVNRMPHPYTLAGSLDRSAGALEENLAVASSRDGRSVVLGGRNIGGSVPGGRNFGVSVLDRDPFTGALSHNHYLLSHPRDRTTLGGIKDLVFAPDDRHVYGVDGQRLACFQRNTMTGKLSVSQILEDGIGRVDGLGGARSVAISEDGASVYVAAYDDDAVSVFDRDQWSGDLTFVETLSFPYYYCLEEPSALVVSPDGEHVYVAAMAFDRGRIMVFDRDLVDGTLSNHHCYLAYGRPWSLVVAPDGNHVYSTDQTGSLKAFKRDPVSGHLSFVESEIEGQKSVTGLINPADLAISPDGKYVFVAGNGSFVVFGRDPVTGALSFLHTDCNYGGGVVNGFPTPYQIAVSADGSDVFYGSFQSLAVFSSRPVSAPPPRHSGDRVVP